MSELKACPFCGSKAVWHHDAYCVECTGCYFAWNRGNKDNSIRTWNIRATPDPLAEKVIEADKLAGEIYSWMSRQKCNGEELLPAGICCDYAGKCQFIRELSKTITAYQKANNNE